MEDQIPFFVRTTFRSESTMISLDRNGLSFHSFKEECKYEKTNCFRAKKNIQLVFHLVIRKFNINITDGSNLRFKLTDHKGTPIPISDFVGIVRTFHKSDFSLVVQYESTVQSRDVKIITPLVCILIIIYSSILLPHFTKIIP